MFPWSAKVWVQTYTWGFHFLDYEIKVKSIDLAYSPAPSDVNGHFATDLKGIVESGLYRVLELGKHEQDGNHSSMYANMLEGRYCILHEFSEYLHMFLFVRYRRELKSEGGCGGHFILSSLQDPEPSYWIANS